MRNKNSLLSNYYRILQVIVAGVLFNSSNTRNNVKNNYVTINCFSPTYKTVILEIRIIGFLGFVNRPVF
jgi:hypothetical protein